MAFKSIAMFRVLTSLIRMNLQHCTVCPHNFQCDSKHDGIFEARFECFFLCSLTLSSDFMQIHTIFHTFGNSFLQLTWPLFNAIPNAKKKQERVENFDFAMPNTRSLITSTEHNTMLISPTQLDFSPYYCNSIRVILSFRFDLSLILLLVYFVVSRALFLFYVVTFVPFESHFFWHLDSKLFFFRVSFFSFWTDWRNSNDFFGLLAICCRF